MNWASKKIDRHLKLTRSGLRLRFEGARECDESFSGQVFVDLAESLEWNLMEVVPGIMFGVYVLHEPHVRQRS